MKNKNIFPDIIKSLPLADIPVDGCIAHLLQGDTQQVLFMEFDEDIELPEHEHEAQWGIVLEGEIELKIGERQHIFQCGDTYYIPKGTRHSARIKKGYRDITIFNEKKRYSPKN